jgi:hypothetical protein
LFSDVVISTLFRENVTYEYKRGNILHDSKRDGKLKLAERLLAGEIRVKEQQMVK